MVVYTWWCWHICKEKVGRVDLDQLGEEKGGEKKVTGVTGRYPREDQTRPVLYPRLSLLW